MSEQDGGPAFPLHRFVQPEWDGFSGMSLRDYFAAAAMQGLVAKIPPAFGERCDAHTPDSVARGAYDYADAMLRARKESQV